MSLIICQLCDKTRINTFTVSLPQNLSQIIVLFIQNVLAGESPEWHAVVWPLMFEKRHAFADKNTNYVCVEVPPCFIQALHIWVT